MSEPLAHRGLTDDKPNLVKITSKIHFVNLNIIHEVTNRNFALAFLISMKKIGASDVARYVITLSCSRPLMND